MEVARWRARGGKPGAGSDEVWVRCSALLGVRVAREVRKGVYAVHHVCTTLCIMFVQPSQTCAPQGGTGHCAPGASQVCPCRAAGNCEFVVGEMASRPLGMYCPCLFARCPWRHSRSLILTIFLCRHTTLRWDTLVQSSDTERGRSCRYLRT